jgi:hypothetical protein
MQGIGNAMDYETAFEEKGVIGSLLEISGSTYIVYRALDELADELDDDGRSHRKKQDDSIDDVADDATDGAPVDPVDPVDTGTIVEIGDGTYLIITYS